VFSNTACAVGNGKCVVEIYLMCSSVLAVCQTLKKIFKIVGTERRLLIGPAREAYNASPDSRARLERPTSNDRKR